MDKKTLPLVIVLVVLIVFYQHILQFLNVLPEPAPTPSVEQQQQTAVPDSVIADTFLQATPVAASQEIEPSPERLRRMQAETATDSISADTIRIVTNKYDVILSSYGGGPVSMILKEYTYRDGEPIQMLPEAEFATPDFEFAGRTFSSSNLNYASSEYPGEYEVTNDTLELVYEYTGAEGGRIIKRYRFYPDEYHYDLALQVEGRESLGFERQYSMVWNTPLGVTEPQPATDYDAMQAVAMMSNSRETLDDFEDNRLNQSLTGYTSWAGVRAKYFAAVIMPQSRDADGVFARGEKRNVATPDGKVELKEITVGIDLPFATVPAFADSFTIFVGPLDYNLMAEYDVGLEDMLDIGTTPFIGWLIKLFAVPILWVLPRMYDFIPNYGLVIILFALLVKIVTLPLSLKSFKSMQAMKDVQPKLEELKKKHKNNPQALNSEMMKLYKKHGVNPMSGCLPIIPQMPLFFALFSVFRSTILLRDAPFIFFIDDLSMGATSFTDPYIILVVIMVAAQFASQKLTMPSTSQNKMLGYIMPLFMGFIFYRFSSGLVLYWTCFSLFSLLDYVIFKRPKKNVEVKAA